MYVCVILTLTCRCNAVRGHRTQVPITLERKITPGRKTSKSVVVVVVLALTHRYDAVRGTPITLEQKITSGRKTNENVCVCTLPHACGNSKPTRWFS